MDASELAIEVTQLHAELCAAMADPHRILILYLLADQPLNVTTLAELVGVTQPTASRHLKILRERGMVHATRQGVNIVYRLGDNRLIEALDLLRAILRDRISYRASLMEAANLA